MTYTAIVSAPNPEQLLLPGMTAVLRIVISDTGDTLKIPNQALRFRPVGTGGAAESIAASPGSSASRVGKVWVVGSGGGPVPLDVSIGVSDENSTQLLDGALQEGQQLIVGIATPQSRVTTLGLPLGF